MLLALQRRYKMLNFEKIKVRFLQGMVFQSRGSSNVFHFQNAGTNTRSCYESLGHVSSGEKEVSQYV